MVDYLQTEVEKLFTDMVTAIDVATQQPQYAQSRNHHIYLNIVPEFVYEPEKIDQLIRKMGQRYGEQYVHVAVAIDVFTTLTYNTR
jgi:hypothetical protein